jgi:pimeloyl-ACP methyl ester carboxylesterase
MFTPIEYHCSFLSILFEVLTRSAVRISTSTAQSNNTFRQRHHISHLTKRGATHKDITNDNMEPFDVLSSVATVTLAVTAVIMFVAYKYKHLQDMMVYHPHSPEDSHTHCMQPHEVGLTRHEPVTITTVDGVSLKGFFAHPNDGAAPTFTLIYFHGNAGNVGHRMPIARLLIESLRCSVLMVDYRGFGLSDPVQPTEEGLKLDAQATIDFALKHSKTQKDRLFVLGTSLGGAVAIDVASRPAYASALCGVMIENSFTSISDMADVLFVPLLQRLIPRASVVVVPLLKHVVKPIVMFVGWWSIDRVCRVSTPLLFLSGKKDELIPPHHIKSLHAAAERSKKSDFIQLVEFPHGKHNDLFVAPGYTQSIEAFVREAMRKRQVHVV